MKQCEARKKCPNEFVFFTPGGELLQINQTLLVLQELFF